MEILETPLPGVLRLTPRRFGDARGFFSESWNKRTLEEAGVHLPDFVQDNHSLSDQVGTVRGLHYQAPPHAQGKLVRCGRGGFSTWRWMCGWVRPPMGSGTARS